MSSPCTVAAACSPMHPRHTHGHAIHRVNLRCKRFHPMLCGVTRAVQAVLQQSVCVCVHCLPGNLAAVRRRLFGAQKYAQGTSISATTCPPRSLVAISDSTTFSASSGCVDAYNSGLACVFSLRDPTSRPRLASPAAPCQSPPILS